MRTIALFMLLAVALTGCAVKRPAAHVAEVRVQESTPEGTRVLITLALQNPRPDPLPIRETRYTLKVGGDTFAFTDKTTATMPASGAQTLQLPAAVRVPGDAIGDAAFELRGAVVYEPPGELRDMLSDSRVPLPTVSFAHTGRLPAARATPTPPAAPPQEP